MFDWAPIASPLGHCQVVVRSKQSRQAHGALHSGTKRWKMDKNRIPRRFKLNRAQFCHERVHEAGWGKRRKTARQLGARALNVCILEQSDMRIFDICYSIFSYNQLKKFYLKSGTLYNYPPFNLYNLSVIHGNFKYSYINDFLSKLTTQNVVNKFWPWNDFDDLCQGGGQVFQ